MHSFLKIVTECRSKETHPSVAFGDSSPQGEPLLRGSVLRKAHLSVAFGDSSPQGESLLRGSVLRKTLLSFAFGDSSLKGSLSRVTCSSECPPLREDGCAAARRVMSYSTLRHLHNLNDFLTYSFKIFIHIIVRKSYYLKT